MLLRFSIPLCILLGFFSLSAFASEKEGTKTESQSHSSQHPPHTHHDTDHLKYIRGHGQKKKKISL